MIKTVKVKSSGKVNIGLNIVGRVNEYHSLDTVIAEINFYDIITLRNRNDKKINLTVRGHGHDSISVVDNNVYKTAQKFMETFSTNGADIILQKNIPVGSGLGGSSADIVGTAKAMAKAYEIEDGLSDFVKSLCSDGEFLLTGGCCRVCGKGNVVEKINMQKPLYFLIAIPECIACTKDIFEEFDKGNYCGFGADISQIIESLKKGENIKERRIFNALFEPAKKITPAIEELYEKMINLNPSNIFMSGSGSAVCAIFDSVDLCLWAKQKIDNLADVYIKETII